MPIKFVLSGEWETRQRGQPATTSSSFWKKPRFWKPPYQALSTVSKITTAATVCKEKYICPIAICVLAANLPIKYFLLTVKPCTSGKSIHFFHLLEPLQIFVLVLFWFLFILPFCFDIFFCMEAPDLLPTCLYCKQHIISIHLEINSALPW